MPRNGPEYVVTEDGCWQWQRAISGPGYASARVDGKTRNMHRVYYERANGPVPEGLELDHACRNRACVNPAHLRAVTRGQNNQNRAVINGRGSSRYRGVAIHAPSGQWQAYAQKDGKRTHLGYFDSEGAAAAAVTAWRAENLPFSDADRPLAQAS